MRTTKTIAGACVAALAILVLTFGFSSTAAAQDSGEYIPSSIGGEDQGRGAGAVAQTGSDSTIPLAALGIILVSVGGVVIALARRRRITAHTV